MGDWMDGNKGLGGIAKQIERQKEVKAQQNGKRQKIAAIQDGLDSLHEAMLERMAEAMASSGVLPPHGTPPVDVGSVKLGCAPGPAKNPFRMSSCSLAGPVGSGIPNAYPICGGPLDTTELIPSSEALYDTINLIDGMRAVTFFQCPVGTIDNGRGKTHSETNINQSSMLDYPCRFDARGISVEVHHDTLIADYASIMRHATVCLMLKGEARLKMPLDRILSHGGVPMYLFSDVPINCAESFNVVVDFEKRLSLTKPVSLKVILGGTFWKPKK